jgi:hypothetical protein
VRDGAHDADDGFGDETLYDVCKLLSRQPRGRSHMGYALNCAYSFGDDVVHGMHDGVCGGRPGGGRFKGLRRVGSEVLPRVHDGALEA